MVNTEVEQPAPFIINHAKGGMFAPLQRPFIRGAEHLLGLRRCQKLYEKITDCSTETFAGLALRQLDVTYQLSDHDRSRIPASGPCILIANHPYGGIEGLALIDVLNKIRPDFKVMANYILARIPQLRPQLICVDPFGGEAAAGRNLVPLRQSLNWLRQGGLLVIFPAGEVSSRHATGQGVTDPPWNSALPRLARMSGAPVLPVFFTGHNGRIFQLAGRIHPRLRTAMLPRMLLDKRGQVLNMKVGNLLPRKKIAEFASDQDLSDYLRLRTYALGLRCQRAQQSRKEKIKVECQEPLIEAQDADLLQMEIDQLPGDRQLLSSGEFDVLVVSFKEAPLLVHEIGRLREQTFRRVGEGTGRSLDLDRFDHDYSHLLLWHREKKELVGAYRIGRFDRLLVEKGVDGLYTSTLFDFKPQLLEKLQNALELGRSFVRPEYQRSYAPLLLLWKGIGHYLVANPHYRYLIGPVSISNDYSIHSRQLMTSVLSRHYLINELARLVTPRIPVSLKPVKIHGLSNRQCGPLLQDMEEVSALVADIEADNKGIPVLLRHYLSLGGRLLAFNLDQQFSDVIDGLLLVDLLQTERKQLQRYMGREGVEFYFSTQQQLTTRCA